MWYQAFQLDNYGNLHKGTREYVEAHTYFIIYKPLQLFNQKKQ